MSQTDGGIAISCSNLTKDFGEVRALDSLDLEVPAGEVYGFLGPNGAGKTTTINLLLGLLEPTAGEAKVLGHRLPEDGTEVRRSCGVVLEYPGVYERMTAEDNLRFFGRAYGLDTQTLGDRIEELLKHFGLFDRRRDMSGTWSRGMRQRLALTRALIHEPKLLFLDEPTAGLDPVVSRDLRDELMNLVKARGVTVLLATHNLAEAEQLSDKVAVINDGRLVALDEPRDLKSAYGQSATIEVRGSGFTEELIGRLRAGPDVASASLKDGTLFLNMRAGGAVPEVVRALVHDGASIEEVRRQEATFEDAMLRIMREDT